jgi:hypothetical protein
MSFATGETIDVLTAGTTTDPYSGKPTADWDNATSVSVSGVAVEPRPSGEPLQDARNQIVNGFTLYLPAGTAINAQSRVVVRGNTYDVLGEPADWRSPFDGWQPGLVVQVERSRG